MYQDRQSKDIWYDPTMSNSTNSIEFAFRGASNINS